MGNSANFLPIPTYRERYFTIFNNQLCSRIRSNVPDLTFGIQRL